jgi:hypothetical protein
MTSSKKLLSKLMKREQIKRASTFFFPEHNNVKGFMGTGDIFFVGQKPSTGKFPTNKDKLFYRLLGKYGFANAHITDLIKTRGKTVAQMAKDELESNWSVFKKEIKILKPILIVAIGNDVYDNLKSLIKKSILIKIMHYSYRYGKKTNIKLWLEKDINNARDKYDIFKEMNKSQRLKYATLISAFEHHKRDFNRIINFISKNQHFFLNDLQRGLKRVIIPTENAKINLRSLFVQTINAAGGNNLTLTGKGCKKFWNRIKGLPNDKIINYGAFLKCLGDNKKSTEDLFKRLLKFNNIGKKKAALFIRDLFYAHKNPNNKTGIFKKCTIKEDELLIPLDTVISEMLNMMLGLRGTAKVRPGDFDMVNLFAKEVLKNKHMLIEDLWYWGHFSTRRKAKTRIMGFNEDMYYADIFTRPNERSRRMFKTFAKLLKQIK